MQLCNNIIDPKNFKKYKGGMKPIRFPLWSGFTMVEVLAVLAALAIIGSIGYVTVSDMKENADSAKLRADVESINRSIQLYLSNGGSLEGVETPDAVLAKLKTKGDASKILGVTSSVLDARIVADYGDASSRLRARWLPAPDNRFVVEAGTDGVVEFRLDESAAAVAPTMENDRSAPKQLAQDSNWVWDFQNAPAATAATEITPETADGTGFALGGANIAQLAPPTISPSGGTSDLADFPQPVTITDNNTPGTSQIYYSSGGSYTLYTGPITVSPGPLSAVAISLDPSRYANSPTQTATYFAQVNLDWTAPSSLTYAEITDGTPDSASVAADGAGPFSIYYTTDGTTPSASSTAYTAAITLSAGMWPTSSTSLSLKAIAISTSEYYTSSSVTTAQVSAVPTSLLAPTISPGSQVLYSSQSVSITAATGTPAGAVIYYTTDGSTPSANNGTLYSGAFTVNQPNYNSSTTVQAIATAPSGLEAWLTASNTTSATYTGLNFDYYNLQGVLIGGGNIANNAALNGSVVLVSVPGAQPNVTFNNNSEVSGDIYAPGTPTVTGVPSSRIVDLNGSTSPSNYTITVENNAVVGKVYRRITPVTLPTVTLPTGLVERGTATSGVLQPGHYTKVTANNGGTVTLGVAGATTPSEYVIDTLSLNNNAKLKIQGPVILTLNPGTNVNIYIENNVVVGNSAHPEWLELKMYTGNLVVQNNGFLYGVVSAPYGTVTFGNNSVFTGGVAAKYLNVSNNGTGIVFSLPPPTD